MESVGRAIYTILHDDLEVSTILQAAGNTEAIYQNLASQSSPDSLYIRFLVSSVEPNDTKSGPSTIDDMFVQVDCFGRKEAQSEALNKAVREALDRYPHGIVDTIDLQGVRFMKGFMSPKGGDTGDFYQFTTIFQCRVGRSDYLVPAPPPL